MMFRTLIALALLSSALAVSWLKTLTVEVLRKKNWFQRGDPQECELCRTGVNVMYGHLRVDEVGHEMELLEMGVCQQLDDPQACKCQTKSARVLA